ncbi:MAG TPA: hypothetical protein ENI99_05335 [Sedimenticola sp.]|nr:hypothetical protein [Sedimenticola sp.]
MLALLNYFFDLCLLRARPQDIPASSVLLALTLAANLVVGMLVMADAYGGALRALFAGLVDNLLLLGLLWGLLYWKGRPARLNQAATALFGSGTLLGLIFVPLSSLAGPGQSGTAALAGLFSLLLLAWSQFVMGHILRHTLEVPLTRGLLLAVAFSILSVFLVRGLFPLA